MFDSLLKNGKSILIQQFKVTYRPQIVKTMDHKKHRVPTSLNIMKELEFRQIEPSFHIAITDDLLEVIVS